MRSVVFYYNSYILQKNRRLYLTTKLPTNTFHKNGKQFYEEFMSITIKNIFKPCFKHKKINIKS